MMCFIGHGQPDFFKKLLKLLAFAYPFTAATGA
jgi:hypothetical protein